MREHREITSREQVVAAAQRQEELAAQQSKSEPKAEQKTVAMSTPTRHTASERLAKSTTPTSSKGKSDGKPKCFNCGKLGHIAKDCRGPKKEATGQPGSTESKNQKPKS